MAEKGPPQRDESQLQPANLTTLISEFALAASAHLGQLRAFETDDMTIELLKEKTQGNLANSEGEFLEGTQYNLRMIYVRAAQNPHLA